MGAVKRKRKEKNAVQQSGQPEDEAVAGVINDDSSKRRKEQPKVASSWLENFLAQKRDVLVPVPVECELADDTYLREFNLQFSKSITAADSSDDENDGSDGTVLLDVEVVVADKHVPVDEAEIQLTATYVKIKLFNLPYRISESKVQYVYKCVVPLLYLDSWSLSYVI